MSQVRFRHPSEMPKEEKRPISARVKISTCEALEAAAKENGLSLAELISNVLDDYVQFLSSAKKPTKR